MLRRETESQPETSLDSEIDSASPDSASPAPASLDIQCASPRNGQRAGQRLEICTARSE